MPRAGDNILLFALKPGVPAFIRVYQRGESLPDPSFPDKEAASPFACPALRLPPSSSTADTARPTCAADGSAWGSALYGRRNVSSGGWRCVVRLWGRRRLVATGEWRPGVWWHIGRREGGTSSGVERRHQMDYEGSEDGPRASSSSIWEYPKLTTTSRATGAGSLDGG